MALFKHYLNLSILMVFLHACSHTNGFTRQSENPYHHPSISTGFIQGEIPAWANYSSIGKCHRSSNVRYLEYAKIHNSYGLTYYETVLWQYLYNYDSKIKTGDKRLYELPEQVNSQVFFEARNKMISRIDIQKYPQFDTLHVVWIDSLLTDKKGLARFKTLRDQQKFSQGYPVFISDCLGHSELNQFLDEHGWEGMTRYVLGAEAFNYFANDFSPSYQPTLSLTSFFKDRKVILYGTQIESLEAFPDVLSRREF